MAPTITRIESIEFSYPVEDVGYPPDGPGLGVDYDWDYIQANQTGSVHTYE